MFVAHVQAPAFAEASASAQGATDRPAGRQQQPAPRQGGLFPATDLGLLESPDRAAWQKPELIMDALRIAEKATVADIGAGAGFFTVRLADRVGPNGIVYAEDIQQEM